MSHKLHFIFSYIAHSSTSSFIENNFIKFSILYLYLLQINILLAAILLYIWIIIIAEYLYVISNVYFCTINVEQSTHKC